MAGAFTVVAAHIGVGTVRPLDLDSDAGQPQREGLCAPDSVYGMGTSFRGGSMKDKGWERAFVLCACVLLQACANSDALDPSVLARDGSLPPPACTPGEADCIPTPQQCATGTFNGVWRTSSPSRFAVCLGAGGVVLHYIGGDVQGRDGPCGTVIAADVLVAGNWSDPNLCPAADSFPDPGVIAGTRYRPAVSGRAAIATESAQATLVGLDVLKSGGNAMDAAVAATFAVGVSRPEWCGPGAGGYLVYRRADGEAAVLDFRSQMPAAITPQSFQQRDLRQLGTGHLSIGVPGMVDGMAKALARYGTIGLAQAIAPAERMARGGILVTPEQNRDAFPPLLFGVLRPDLAAVGELVLPQKTQTARLRLFPATAAIYLRNGLTPYPPDSILVQKDYADSLRLIAEQGPDAFYRGRIAELIVQDMEASRLSPLPGDAGVMTREDLAGYQALWREPVRTTYRGHEVITVAPSSGGGLVVAEALNILEGFDLGAFGFDSADRLHLIAEAAKIAWADRNAYVADPAFVRVPVAEMLDKTYAAARRNEIDPHQAKAHAPGSFAGFKAGTATPGSSRHTTHVSVVDAMGNAVAITCSTGIAFGSGVVAPGTGFTLNDDSDFGPPGSANQAEGGKRVLSSQTPTIVVRDGRTILVAGGAGADAIPMGVLNSIVNVVDLGMDPALAVDAPRSHALECCSMTLEQLRFSSATVDELGRRGHSLLFASEYFPVPVMQLVGAGDGEALAASDPRGEAGAGAVP
jgi:gamma-glutamyltranspeptidase/glutathione hydrolase